MVFLSSNTKDFPRNLWIFPNQWIGFKLGKSNPETMHGLYYFPLLKSRTNNNSWRSFLEEFLKFLNIEQFLGGSSRNLPKSILPKNIANVGSPSIANQQPDFWSQHPRHANFAEILKHWGGMVHQRKLQRTFHPPQQVFCISDFGCIANGALHSWTIHFSWPILWTCKNIIGF